MAVKWPVVCLRDLCDAKRGITYGIVQPGSPQKTGVPIIRADDVDDGRISTSNLMRVAPAVEASYLRSRIRGGEVLLTLVGAYFGKSAVTREEHIGFNTARAVGVIPVLQDADFISFALRSPICQLFINERANTTAQPTLNLSDVADIPIPWPREDVRAMVTGIFRALDNKIELCRQMNQTLEAMAQAIFKDWFVDFGPTRAKMEGRLPYLAPEIWALFPDRLDDGGKPEGWHTKPLDQIAEFLNGIALQKYPAQGDSYLPVIKIAQLRAGNANSSDRASADIPPAYIVDDGDILFSWSGSLLHRVWTAGRGALNQHLFKVSSRQYPKWFFFHWLGHYMPEFQATAASKATTMGHIQRHHLAQAITMVADKRVMEIADKVIAPIFDRCITNDLECQTLMATRDLLLPKLMSGEIQLRDAEKALEAVA